MSELLTAAQQEFLLRLARETITAHLRGEKKPSPAAADPVLKGNDIVNPLNTVWTLLAAFGFMVTLVLAANLFADGVRDAFDPRLRRDRA